MKNETKKTCPRCSRRLHPLGYARHMAMHRDADRLLDAYRTNPATPYERRVREMESEGMTRSDAQAVVDAQDLTRQALFDKTNPTMRNDR